MKAFLRVLALWSLLAAIVWLLIQPVAPPPADLIAGFLKLTLPALAVWLTGRAVAGIPSGTAWSRCFWTLTSAGWLVVLLVAAGLFQSGTDDRTLLSLTILCALGFPAWAALKSRTFPTWSVVRDAASGFAILALASAAFFWRYDSKTRSIAAQAEARWTGIGMPMSEFEKTLAPVAENSGSAVVREVLREQVGTRFYKEGTAAAEREPAIDNPEARRGLVEKAVLILNPKSAPGDALELFKPSVDAMEEHAQALETAHRRILASEPAAWACDPADGWKISVPNFLGIRMFSQLTASESMRLLAAGDEKGAARAIAAGLRVPEGLNQSPTLVALMIHVAVQGLLAEQQARLPAQGDGLASVVHDAAALNESLIRSLQWEAWMCLRHSDRVSDEDFFGSRGMFCLPKSVRRIVDRHFLQRQCALGGLNGAEHVAIRKSPATLALPDCGSSLHEAVSERNPSICDINVSRAAMRIYATLLLREQTELIRDARARLAAGRVVESHDSAVLPGVRWELTADSTKHTVSTRLANAPKWIVEHVVTGDEFWALPIDGSLPWQFRAPALTASANRTE